MRARRRKPSAKKANRWIAMSVRLCVQHPCKSIPAVMGLAVLDPFDHRSNVRCPDPQPSRGNDNFRERSDLSRWTRGTSRPRVGPSPREARPSRPRVGPSPREARPAAASARFDRSTLGAARHPRPRRRRRRRSQASGTCCTCSSTPTPSTRASAGASRREWTKLFDGTGYDSTARNVTVCAAT